MSSLLVVKEQLLKDIAAQLEDVQNHLHSRFKALYEKETDKEKLKQLKDKYMEIGQDITKDYIKRVAQICNAKADDTNYLKKEKSN